MKGRKVIKIKNVGSSIIDGDIPGDWVLTGVVVDKLPPRYELLCGLVCDVSYQSVHTMEMCQYCSDSSLF